MSWNIELETKTLPTLNSPILIEGMPGIGNVGKIAAEFLLAEIKPKPLCSFTSTSMPHSVFINTDNLVELPSIKLYYKQFSGSKQDLLILVGDVQPQEEIPCHEFVETLLDFIEKLHCKEIITLGGIGLSVAPTEPKVYCTANEKKIVQKYKKHTKIISKLYGVVGPIIGVTGLIVGMSKERNIPAIALLAETYGHPMYVGLRGAQEILKLLAAKLGVRVNFKRIAKEIEEIESNMMNRSDDMKEMHRNISLPPFHDGVKNDVNYIG